MVKCMKNKMDDNTKRIITIVILVCVFLSSFSIIYRNKNNKETWLVCTNKTGKYQNYEETIKYRYIGKNLYGFYREEKITEANEKDIEERYNYFLEIKEGLELSDNLNYDVIKNEDNVEVKTYIGVINMPSFFNKYIESTSIKSSSTVSEIKKYYEQEGYECEKSYK